jgi:tetratricopeptide (TPR) repeat protein
VEEQWQVMVILLYFLASSAAFTNPYRKIQTTSMVVFHSPRPRTTFANKRAFDFQKEKERLKRTGYQRKIIPDTEKELQCLRKERQAKFERMMKNADAQGESPSIWSFESLFPGPVIDKQSVHRDLYSAKERDSKINLKRDSFGKEIPRPAVPIETDTLFQQFPKEKPQQASVITDAVTQQDILPFIDESNNSTAQPLLSSDSPEQLTGNATRQVDRGLTRLVEDRILGMRRSPDGTTYDTSTYMGGEGAVQFRDGVRIGNPLKINSDRLNHLAKKEFRHGRIEEAQELYEQAIVTDPRDGRAYLGLSRCAQRRRDFKLARKYLKAGIERSSSSSPADRGANPFLLQALGCLEERMGNIGQAEALYLAAVKSRPSHAAAWVSLAQLRTRKLGQSANAGRLCYQTAAQELRQAGLPPSAHVYTAWAAMEYRKAGDVRKARELFRSALKVDKTCSAALLQLGVMEANTENWEDAQECFEKVLTYDQRNSRVLQAYAIMETKRPDGMSRKAIDLFERALRANPRDAGVLQAYALYVAELGDIDSARKLLERGTTVNKRHSPVWQAWGVLETRHGSAEDARKVFQQGIWECAQLNGDYSGGYHCARLWQAWGVLEAREKDYAAARRCFSRALDADKRNIPAITAWALMEANTGNIRDARSIFERALPKYAPGSEEKIILWRSYELMEQSQANVDAAQQVYQRGIAEAITYTTNDIEPPTGDKANNPLETKPKNVNANDRKEVEVIRWEGGGGEVWMNDRAIEGKLPFNMKKRNKAK